jgi:hypothetical protein
MDTMKRLSVLAAFALFATVAVAGNVEAFGGGGKKHHGAAPSSTSSASPIVIAPGPIVIPPPPGPISVPEPSMLMAAGLGLLSLSYFTNRLR